MIITWNARKALPYYDGPYVQLVVWLQHHLAHTTPSAAWLHPWGTLREDLKYVRQHLDCGYQHNERENRGANKINYLILRFVPYDGLTNHHPHAPNGVSKHM